MSMEDSGAKSNMNYDCLAREISQKKFINGLEAALVVFFFSNNVSAFCLS